VILVFLSIEIAAQLSSPRRRNVIKLRILRDISSFE
jgi:hypothetical protein